MKIPAKTLSLCLVAATVAMPAYSQTSAVAADAAPSNVIDPKWAPTFAAFSSSDKANMPAPGGVLFVGSSSIRLWDNLEKQFSSVPVVIKRGFGGSRMEDCATYLSRLVTPYKPRLVLVYAGENDLAEGRSPEQVLRSFRAFVKGVRTQLPRARIAYISIKPSLARQELMPQIRLANTLISRYVGGLENAEYIDVFSSMLTEQGAPRAELFRTDKLHMNERGYALWKSVIARSVR